MAPPYQSVISVIRTARAEGAAEAGTTRGSGGGDRHPSPKNLAYTTWTPGSSCFKGFKKGGVPHPGPEQGVWTHPLNVHTI